MIHTVKGFGIVNKAEVDIYTSIFKIFKNPPPGSTAMVTVMLLWMWEQLLEVGLCSV